MRSQLERKTQLDNLNLQPSGKFSHDWIMDWNYSQSNAYKDQLAVPFKRPLTQKVIMSELSRNRGPSLRFLSHSLGNWKLRGLRHDRFYRYPDHLHKSIRHFNMCQGLFCLYMNGHGADHVGGNASGVISVKFAVNKSVDLTVLNRFHQSTHSY